MSNSGWKKATLRLTTYAGRVELEKHGYTTWLRFRDAGLPLFTPPRHGMSGWQLIAVPHELCGGSLTLVPDYFKVFVPCDESWHPDDMAGKLTLEWEMLRARCMLLEEVWD